MFRSVQQDNLARRALGVALVAIVAACESSTAPNTSAFDPNVAMADYRALDAVFGTESWQGLQALSGRTPASASGLVRSAGRLHDVSDGRQFVANLLSDLGGPIRNKQSFARAIISASHLGKTMAYDAAHDQYVIDPARAGAPQNGVRFIVYEVDAADRPIANREIGYADLLDEGTTTGEAVALRLLLVTRGTIALDYRTRVEQIGQGGKVHVSGFAGEGANRLTFDVNVSATVANGTTLIDADFDIALSPRNFRIEGLVRGVEEGREGQSDVTLTVRHQEHDVKVAMRGVAGTLDGSIMVNDKLFVTVTGDAAQPTFRGATGQPLTAGEFLVVMQIVDVVDDVFDLVEDLVRPVDNLVLLGWIL